jgi:ABC-type branched-subunit amino acid transport system ATPase component/ABC-type branched-subunit amino acid transport system permease subunit
MTAGAILTWNLLFLGGVRGLVISLVAMGLVLVYRSSRAVNFAVGDLGVPAAALLAVMAGRHGWPYWPALAAALVVGTLAGTLVEVTVVRRLFRSPRVILLVATIGVAQLAQAVTRALPDYRTGNLQTRFPSPLAGEWHPGAGITIRGAHVMALVAVPAIAAALWWLLGHSRFGEAVRATVSNPDLARLTGISPKAVSTAVWTIAGFLSTVAVILIATESGSSDLVAIGPDTLLRGLTAALVGNMSSFPVAVVASVAIGVVDQVLFFNFTGETGLVQFVLFLSVVALVARASRAPWSGSESFQFAPRGRAVPERLRGVWWLDRLPALVAICALAVAVALPLVIGESARHFTYSQVILFALCATSVTVLTGWAGQLSLGQMAFAGLGALGAAALARGVSVDIGWHDLRLVRGTLPSVPFWAAVVLGAVVACGVATLVGIGALRVRGILLAASTLAFAIAAQAYIFPRPILSLGRSTVRFPREAIGPLDITERNRGYYYLSLAVLVVVTASLARLRRSGVGRTILGVRENEPGAAALTVSPARAKLTAYAVSGFVAGLGGALLGGLVVTIGYAERFFRVTDSLALVAMAVIGGLGSLAGAVVGAVWVVGLPAFWPDNDLVPLFTSSIGLLLILLYLPGGFTQVSAWLRDVVVARLERRLPPAPPKSATTPPATLRRRERATASTRGECPALACEGLSVRFGGLVAVDRVGFAAGAGEVIGLIGANGAGKSTLLDALGGFVPAAGRVELFGQDVSGLAPHQRAACGLGRTFQAATLFPELTVRDVVMLALEARGRTPFWPTVLFLPSSTRFERTRRAEADELIDFLGLGRYADHYVAELSTGTRRIVELCAMCAVAPRVVCLDEPTAGVAQREAEAFGPLIQRIRQELGATLVVVEHDLPLVMALSDRMICLEAGRVIADGPPAAVRDDPRVIASYLGTDARAVGRSTPTGATTSPSTRPRSR